MTTEVPEETPANEDHSIDTGVQYEEFRGIQEGFVNFFLIGFFLHLKSLLMTNFNLIQKKKKKKKKKANNKNILELDC